MTFTIERKALTRAVMLSTTVPTTAGVTVHGKPQLVSVTKNAQPRRRMWNTACSPPSSTSSAISQEKKKEVWSSGREALDNWPQEHFPELLRHETSHRRKAD